jgi:DNA-binding MarR family transcriptional regulator
MNETREDLLQKLIEGMTSLMRHIGRSLAPHEPSLSPPQVRLLFAIGSRKEGFQVTELAEKIGITPGAVTQFVDALVEKDLVSRQGDPSDRRIVRLKLTETAKAHYENLRKGYLASMANAFDVLSDAELRELVRIFTKVSAAQEKAA